jgi:hypothetical protein
MNFLFAERPWPCHPEPTRSAHLQAIGDVFIDVIVREKGVALEDHRRIAFIRR